MDTVAVKTSANKGHSVPAEAVTATAAVSAAAATPPAAAAEITEHHHVHFDQTSLKKDECDSDHSVTYQRTGDTIIVHLGFLQINHRYLIELKLPANLFKCEVNSAIIAPANSNSIPNIHCKLIEFSGKDTNKSEYYDMKVEYFAHKEKLLKEEIKLENSKNSEELFTLVITARVLGKGMGTPMLRSGIHCIGFERGNDESDASDYPGFATTKT